MSAIRTGLALLLALAAPALAAEMKGRVVDESGRGIAAATVSVVEAPVEAAALRLGRSLGTDALATAPTDAGGAFRIDVSAVRRGLHVLRVEAAGRAPLLLPNERVAFGGGALPQDLELALLPVAGLDGLVLDERGAAAGATRVTLTCESWGRLAALTLTTGSDGRFRVEGLPVLGQARLVADRDGALAFATLRMPQGGSARVALHLQRSARIAGHVVSAEAEPRPVAGARVVTLVRPDGVASGDDAGIAHAWLHGWVGPALVSSETRTLPDGSFAAELPPGAAVLLVEPDWRPTLLLAGRNVALVAEPALLTVKDGGRPVAGARLVHAMLGELGRSDAAGSIRAPALDAQAVVVATSGAAVFDSLRSGSRTLALPAFRDVSGRLRRRAEGDAPPLPLAGATLRLGFGDTTRGILGATDAEGRFMVSAPSWPQRLTASARGHAITALPPQGAIDLVAVPAPADVRVRVTSAGAAVPGALVVAEPVTPPGALRVATTNAEGVATLPGSGGALRTLTSSRGLRSAAGEIAEPGGVKSVELAKLASLRVRCLDPEGKPLEGAVVTARAPSLGDALAAAARMGEGAWNAWRDPRTEAGSGPDGIALFEGLAAGECVALNVKRPGLAPASVACARPALQGATVEVRLERPATIRGIVTGPVGPVAGARVSAWADATTASAARSPAEAREAWRPLAEAVTDSAGAYALTGLRAGRADIAAEATGFRRSPSIPADLESGADVDLPIQLDPGASIEGRVVLADGSPAGGASVQELASSREARRRGFETPPHLADADGRFAIDGLDPALEALLIARHEGDLSDRRAVKPGGDPITLSIVRRGRIEGRVVGAEEAGAPVGVQCQGAPDGQGMAIADSDGTFSVRGLDAGTYGCTVIAGETGEGSVGGLVVSDGAVTPATIRLGPRTRLDVVVREAETGRLLAGARVRDQAGHDGGVVTDASGRVSLPLVPRPPGIASPVQISASLDGFTALPVTVPTPRPSEIEIVLRPSLVVRGTVVDEAGQAAPGVEVMGGGTRPVTSGSDGSFELNLRRPETGVELRAQRVAPGVIERASLRVDVPAEGLSNVRLVLERIATGSVLVVVTDGGEPAVGARVALVHDVSPGSRLLQDARSGGGGGSAGAGARGETDLEGSFLAEGLRPGEVTILAGRADEGTLRPAGRATIVASQQARAAVTLPGGGRVTGRVVAGGVPEEGASVSAHLVRPGGWRWGEAPLAQGVTGPGGAFTLGPFPESLTRVLVRAEPARDAGLRASTAEAVPGGAPVVLDLAGSTLTARVTDGGEPAGGIAVQAVARDVAPFGREARSLPDGTVSLDGLQPGARYELTASASGRPPATLSAIAPPQGSADAGVLEIGAEGTLRGTAISVTGGLADVMELVLLREGGAFLSRTSVRLDPDGSFTVPAPAGERLQYRASARGLCPVIGVTETSAPLAVVFPRGAELNLAVSGADGRPLPGASARLVSWNGRAADDVFLLSRLPGSRGEISEPGVIVVGPLPAGESVILVERDLSSATITVALTDGERRSLAVSLP